MMKNVRPEHNYGKALVEDLDFSHKSFFGEKTDIQYVINGVRCDLECVNVICWECCTNCMLYRRSQVCTPIKCISTLMDYTFYTFIVTAVSMYLDRVFFFLFVFFTC